MLMRSRCLPFLLFLLIVLAFALQPAAHAQDPSQRPWVGIGMEGATISSVALDSPAMKGGLEVGDVIEACGETPVDSVATLVAFLADKKPGDAVPFHVKRNGAATIVTVTLGSRLDAIGPMGQGGRTVFRSNAAIFPDLVNYEDEISRRFMAHLTDAALNNQWADVLEKRRQALADAGKPEDPRLAPSTLGREWDRFVAAFDEDERALPGFYKLERQSYVRREPLKFERVTRDMLGAVERTVYNTQKIDGVLWAMAQFIDAPFERTAGSDTLVDDAIATVKALLVAMAAAKAELAAAFGKISADEQAFLAQQLPVLAHRFARHIYIEDGAPIDEVRANLRALALTKKIDYAKLAHAGHLLMQAMPPSGFLADVLRPGVAALAPQVLEHAGLKASINGGGGDDAAASCALLIDARGDTQWSAAATAAPAFGGVKLLLDLAGNDVYQAPDFAGIGAAVGGISVLFDTDGDDRYLGHRLCHGASICGVGVLADLAGDDLMVGDAYVGGAAMFGHAVLYDARGNDVRKANIYAWGFAGPKACGALFDGDGEDHTIADGKYPTSYGAPPREYEGNSIGFAIGFRQIAAGGVALNSDIQGHDFISAGEFSIGGAYFLGYGVYHDGAGDDIIHSSRYGVGFGVHSAVGIALDDAGDDVYQGQTAASLGSAWDLGVGMLIDRGGNDVYVAKGLGLGGSAQNGFALLWDMGGDDVYRSGGGGTQGEGSGFEYGNGRGAKNFALLWDDGGNDSYNRGLADGETRLRGTIGIAVDRK
ncbi:MAG: PDZ domain-containing protein [Planctomycetota bacterium]